MEQAFSDEFKKIFLLAFTRELINHSVKGELISLENAIKSEEKEEVGKKGKREIVRELNFPEASVKLNLPLQFQPRRSSQNIPMPSLQQNRIIPPPANQQQIKKHFTKPLLFIPETKLPPHLEYLKPTPTSGMEIDLGKINSLVKDPAVKIIEGNPEERVVVEGTMGIKPTDIILSKEDIDRIISRFSEESKIPVNEGIYRVVVGNLILSAIISEVIGSKFVIKKMSYSINRQQYSTPPFMGNLQR